VSKGRHSLPTLFLMEAAVTSAVSVPSGFAYTVRVPVRSPITSTREP
jgi:hypothetical protein